MRIKVGLPLVYRLQRRTNVKPRLIQQRVPAGYAPHQFARKHGILRQCWLNVEPTSATLAQQ